MKKVTDVFVAPNGKLYRETRVFSRACHEICGVGVTELFRDAYDLNYEKGGEVLIPVEVWPWEIVDHAKDPRDLEGFLKGGGFRLDLDW